LSALAVVLLLSALDQTIVSTAMPRIIEQLHGLSMYAWVSTSYMLTSTVSVPIYGKLSDLYGRKPILILGVVLFLIGSILCGLSGEFGSLPLLGDGMMQLVIFRALQGLGGGALMTCTFAIIADLYPAQERSRLFGLFGSIFGLSTVVGPAIGGFFTDHGDVTIMNHAIAGWRWVFYINLPLGLASLFMIMFRMPTLRHPTGGRVDYLGAALIVLTFAPLLLALSLGGHAYAWSSPRITALFATAAISLILFIIVEARSADAIFPLHLFRSRSFSITNLATFVIGMAFLGVVMFMPLYMQVVQGVSATHSGFAILPLMGGLIFGSMISGRLVANTGRYKPFMVGGAVLLCVGVALLMQIGPDTSTLDLAWRLGVTGLGLGPAQSLFNLVIQNAVPPAQLGVATSAGQFSRQIGSTVGVAIFGTFLTHSLSTELPRHMPLSPGASTHEVSLGEAQSQAMNLDSIRVQIDAATEQRYALIERAYHDDAQAIQAVVSDVRLPEPIKAPLRDGGLRLQIHRQLEDRARYIESELQQGVSGREHLLADPQLTPELKQSIAEVPDRALRDPVLVARVTLLFRQAVMSAEDAMVAAQAQRALTEIHGLLQTHANRLTQQTQRGIKEAFAASISNTMGKSLWIVLVGLVIILMIPDIPLKPRATPVVAAPE
jgi:EmrB/QacA subfamily drug resistance transporter